MNIIYNETKAPLPSSHYIRNHNHIPPWILFRNISFGNIINLYDLLNRSDKIELTESIIHTDMNHSLKIEFLFKSLHLLRRFRNKIAHNLKFVDFKVPNINKLPAKTAIVLSHKSFLTWKDIKKHHRGLNDVYGMVFSILSLLDSDYLKFEFLRDIYGLIDYSYLDIDDPRRASKQLIVQNYLDITNLPQDLHSRLLRHLSQ